MISQNNANQNEKNVDLNKINYEKLFSQICDFKSEINSNYLEIKSFFSSFLSSKFQSSLNDLENFIKIMNLNKKISLENIKNLQLNLISKFNKNKNKVEIFKKKLNELTIKSQKLNLGKNNFIELNLFKKSEIISLKYKLFLLNKSIKNTQNEIKNIENQINKFSIEINSTCQSEFNLLEQIMNYDKKIYNIVNARDPKFKEKHLLENDVKNLKEKQKKNFDNFKKQKISDYNQIFNEIQEKNNLNNKIKISIENFQKFVNFNKIFIENFCECLKKKKIDNNNNNFNINTIKEENEKLKIEFEKEKINYENLLIKIINESKKNFNFLICINPIQNSENQYNQIILNLNNFLNENNNNNEILMQKKIELKDIKDKIIKIFQEKKNKKIKNIIFDCFKSNFYDEKEKKKKENEIKVKKQLELIKEQLNLQKKIKEEERKKIEEENKIKEEKINNNKKKNKKKKYKNKKNEIKDENDDNNNNNEIKKIEVNSDSKSPLIKKKSLIENKNESQKYNLDFNDMSFIGQLGETIRENSIFSNNQTFGKKNRLKFLNHYNNLFDSQ